MEQCDSEGKRRQGSDASRWRRALDPAELAERQDLYNGFGNGLALGFELAVTPAVFGAIGYGLDRWLGLLPVLTIVFVLLAVAGLSVRQFAAYTVRMKLHDTEGPWSPEWVARPAAAPTAAPTAAGRTASAPPDVAIGGPAGRQRRRHARQQVTS